MMVDIFKQILKPFNQIGKEFANQIAENSSAQNKKSQAQNLFNMQLNQRMGQEQTRFNTIFVPPVSTKPEKSYRSLGNSRFTSASKDNKGLIFKPSSDLKSSEQVSGISEEDGTSSF